MSRAPFASRWGRPLALPLLVVMLGAVWTTPAAAAVTINERVPVSTFDDSPCTGETMTVEGTLHVKGSLTEDRRGGVHFRGFTTFHATGVGLDTGATYQIIKRSTESAINADSDGAPLTFSANELIHFIRLGEVGGADDDFWARGTFHTTINANGNVTAQVELLDGACERP
jgi:hypothetical protein